MSPDPSLPISLDGFLRELGLAWQRLSLYHEGHPARREVVVRPHAVLAALAAAGGSFGVGVARDGFVGRDRKVEGGPAARLAEALYRRHVALVRFDEETAPEDLNAFLEAVPRGRPSDDDPPLWDVLADRGVSRVRLEPLELTFVESGDGDGGGSGSEPFWDGLLRAVLGQVAGEGGAESGAESLGDGGLEGAAGGTERPPAARSARGVAELVERVLARRGISLEELRRRSPGGRASAGARAGAAGGGRAGPGDAVTALGEALGTALASRLAAGRGGGTGHDAAALLRALPDAVGEIVLDQALTALVAEAGAPDETAGASERVDGLRSLTEALPAIQVVAALRRVRAAGVTFSPAVVALIDGLIAHAGRAAPAAAGADELAGELAALFGDEDPDRRLPAEDEIDRVALELARAAPTDPDPEEVSLRVESLTGPRQLAQLAATCLDLLVRPFLKRPAQEAVVRRLGEAFRALLADGKLAQAMAIPERLQELRAAAATAEAAELGLAEMRRPESAVAFLERPDELPEPAAVAARKLIDLLGDQVLDGLLEALCEEEDLSRRRQIFDLMVALGPPVVPRARALLADERWYVQRNMIALLRQIGGGLPVEALRHGLERPDPRVRLEAVKGLGRGPVTPELIARAVKDPDPKVAQAAVAAVGKHRLAAGVGPLVALLAPLDPFGRNRTLRLRALEALGQLGEPSALDGIAHMLRPWFSPVSTEERRAAFASLAGYPPESRRAWFDKGRWSSDPEVRRLCREIRQGTEARA